jgi:hypothetical protein
LKSFYLFTFLLGPAYIRLNQSAIRSKKQLDIAIVKEHKEIYNKVENHLTEYHHLLKTTPILKQYSHHLLSHIEHCYFAPSFYKDQLQAQEQAQIAQSIRETIKQQKLIIRVTDKSNVFYCSSMIDFEHKVEKYFIETNAFLLLSHNPFNEIFDKVTDLLKKLSNETPKRILQWQCKKMMPDLTKCELAHLYFNPKTHKVCTDLLLVLLLLLFK